MSDNDSARQPGPSGRRLLFSWRTLRRILIVLAWTATLIALFYAEENWRGTRAWNENRRQLEANGARLDLATFIPKEVPDEQNFAATPFVKSWFIKEKIGPGDKLWMDSYSPASSMVTSSTTKTAPRQFMDLPSWEKAFEAVHAGQTNSFQKFKSEKLDLESRAKASPAVLEGLRTSQVHLKELADASHRPFSRYPVVYDLENPWGILLPHLAQIKKALERLQLQACVRLAANQTDEALGDVNLMLFLADSMKDEPFLISYLVRLTSFQMAIHPIWEGLAEHRWSDAQLQQLERRLLQHDFVVDMRHPLDAERAAGILTCDLLAQGKYTFSMLASPSPQSGTGEPPPIAGLIPRGWYALEKVNYCRLYQLELEGTFDLTHRQISPSRTQAEAHAMEREFAGSAGNGNAFKALVLYHRLIAALLLPALGNVSRHSAEAQTSADEAALACALERYRLANGRFPDKLEALVPQFISQTPHDLITGEPYKYHLTDDGQFVLYSIGWNEKDDGGVPGKALFDEKQGDWVWKVWNYR